MGFTFESAGPEATETFGFELGCLARPGLVVALSGGLGAGKTLMTKGIARGMDVPQPKYVTSPTFTIHKCYEGRCRLDHLDFYRLGEEVELEDLGLEEVLVGSGVCVIEWPDDFFSLIGSDRIEIAIEILEADRRLLTITWRGEVAEAIGSALRQIYT
jgi:tRNA threonylcarbamoyladenosine biosynthesis protein TsaE